MLIQMHERMRSTRFKTLNLPIQMPTAYDWDNSYVWEGSQGCDQIVHYMHSLEKGRLPPDALCTWPVISWAESLPLTKQEIYVASFWLKVVFPEPGRPIKVNRQSVPWLWLIWSLNTSHLIPSLTLPDLVRMVFGLLKPFLWKIDRPWSIKTG